MASSHTKAAATGRSPPRTHCSPLRIRRERRRSRIGRPTSRPWTPYSFSGHPGHPRRTAAEILLCTQIHQIQCRMGWWIAQGGVGRRSQCAPWTVAWQHAGRTAACSSPRPGAREAAAADAWNGRNNDATLSTFRSREAAPGWQRGKSQGRIGRARIRRTAAERGGVI
ncbi:hypothetical protein K466DRAFT_387637 [Polyporus arcularius HHB13444]|uniref:Uncharacterized protein n=1 Tax=Polyporus arcularius HHB13444 TaxID=1314778 RepID=A0A5C3NS88_9APHY|nr:hypothetical protein K466DRAFT_387637 [Polyporus arcularius HHB13444]